MFWLVLKGKNLGDCEFHRYYSATIIFKKNGKLTFGKKPPNGDGYVEGAKIGTQKTENDLHEGSNNMKPVPPTTFIVLADAPGNGPWPAAQFPRINSFNYYVFAKSKQKGKIVAEIWYDVVVSANAPGMKLLNDGPQKIVKDLKEK